MFLTRPFQAHFSGHVFTACCSHCMYVCLLIDQIDGGGDEKGKRKEGDDS